MLEELGFHKYAGIRSAFKNLLSRFTRKAPVKASMPFPEPAINKAPASTFIRSGEEIHPGHGTSMQERLGQAQAFIKTRKGDSLLSRRAGDPSWMGDDLIKRYRTSPVWKTTPDNAVKNNYYGWR